MPGDEERSMKGSAHSKNEKLYFLTPAQTANATNLSVMRSTD